MFQKVTSIVCIMVLIIRVYVKKLNVIGKRDRIRYAGIEGKGRRECKCPECTCNCT